MAVDRATCRIASGPASARLWRAREPLPTAELDVIRRPRGTLSRS